MNDILKGKYIVIDSIEKLRNVIGLLLSCGYWFSPNISIKDFEEHYSYTRDYNTKIMIIYSEPNFTLNGHNCYKNDIMGYNKDIKI